MLEGRGIHCWDQTAATLNLSIPNEACVVYSAGVPLDQGFVADLGLEFRVYAV